MRVLFCHLGKQTLPPKIWLNEINKIFQNRSGMVGEVVLPLIIKNNSLNFATVFLVSLIFKDFLKVILPPFLEHL